MIVYKVTDGDGEIVLYPNMASLSDHIKAAPVVGEIFSIEVIEVTEEAYWSSPEWSG